MNDYNSNIRSNISTIKSNQICQSQAWPPSITFYDKTFKTKNLIWFEREHKIWQAPGKKSRLAQKITKQDPLAMSQTKLTALHKECNLPLLYIILYYQYLIKTISNPERFLTTCGSQITALFTNTLGLGKTPALALFSPWQMPINVLQFHIGPT